MTEEVNVIEIQDDEVMTKAELILLIEDNKETKRLFNDFACLITKYTITWRGDLEKAKAALLDRLIEKKIGRAELNKYLVINYDMLNQRGDALKIRRR